MLKLVDIEGDEIVVRISLSAISISAPYAWDKAYGYGNHDYKVSDSAVFAKELVSELRNETETGETLVHEMLDKACIRAVENGCEGVKP